MIGAATCEGLCEPDPDLVLTRFAESLTGVYPDDEVERLRAEWKNEPTDEIESDAHEA